MAEVEDRVAALELRMDHHTAMLGDLRDDVRQLRGEVVQLGGDLRGEMRQLGSDLRREFHSLRDDMNRRFEQVDQRFAWLVGIQIGTLVSIIGALVGVLYR